MGAAGASLALILAPTLVDLPAPSASAPTATTKVAPKPVDEAALKREAARKAAFEAKRAAIQAKEKAAAEAAAAKAEKAKAAKAAKAAAKAAKEEAADTYGSLVEKASSSVAAPVITKAKAAAKAEAAKVVDIGDTAASLKDMF